MPKKTSSQQQASDEPAERAQTSPTTMTPAPGQEPKGSQATAVALAQTYSPPELLNLAILKKSDIAVIERLATLAERWQEAQDKRRALIAFNNAIADAKPNIPTIKKTSRVKFESTKGGADTDYMYEDFAAVAETVAPHLGPVGLSYRYRLAQPTPDTVTVTCVLSHRDGHMEETPLTCKVDPSGNKNHIQAISSAVTYLERITLKAAIGIAAGKDDDGRASGRPMEQDYVETISPQEIVELKLKCKSVGCGEKQFLKWAGAAEFEDIAASYFQACLDGLSAFKKSA